MSEKKKKKEESTISFRMCEVVSDTSHLTEDTIKSVLSRACIDKWCYILHDKDTKEDGTFKNPHFHVYMHFDDSIKLSSVARWFGLGESFVSKILGRRFENALLYAIHDSQPQKYQYSPESVKASFDYVAELDKMRTVASAASGWKTLAEKIASGEIRRFNITSYVDVETYVKHKDKINAAFEYREKSLLVNSERKMDVVYICGSSGSGKTTYAKYIAKEKGLSVCVSSGSNDPLQDYAGQDCLILDDFRSGIFPLSDVLKILDNNTSSSVRSRYHNKFLECSLLIITTTQEIDDFYRCFADQKEDFFQFKRRCKTLVRVDKKCVTVYCFNPDTGNYVPFCQDVNPCAVRFPTPTLKESALHSIDVLGLSDKYIKLLNV